MTVEYNATAASTVTPACGAIRVYQDGTRLLTENMCDKAGVVGGEGVATCAQCCKANDWMNYRDGVDCFGQIHSCFLFLSVIVSKT